MRRVGIATAGSLTVAFALLLLAACVLIATDDDGSKDPETWHVALTTAAAAGTVLLAVWGFHRESVRTLAVAALCDLIVFLAVAAIIGGTG